MQSQIRRKTDQAQTEIVPRFHNFEANALL